jgi:hypothetical protein
MTPEQILQIEKNIVLTLKNIYDPEIPVNIYDLGLIYEINFEPTGVAEIIMTLTAPNCPMADQLLADSFDQQSCYNRTVHAAAQRQKNLLIADLLTDQVYLLVDKCLGQLRRSDALHALGTHDDLHGSILLT